MHSALLRRINIQRSEQLSKISINPITNIFCIGDSKGFLQIINYPKIITQVLPVSREESFSQNQNCFQFIPNIHHKSSISLISWNKIYNKITTVDTDGVLIVWKKINGIFNIEMVNNRQESFIKDIKWSKNGEYICFIYEDGQIFTGLVNGNHDWYNCAEPGLNFVEFSPDNKKILISKKKEKIFIFSINGQQIGEIYLDEPYNEYDIATIDWFCDYRMYYTENLFNSENNLFENSNTNVINNKADINQNEEILIKDSVNINEYNKFSKHLMIAFRNGVILFFNDENDKEPIVVKTELNKILGAQWEPKGTYFIIAGNFNDSRVDNKSENNTKSIVLFYNLEGDMIKLLVCPNKIFSFSMGNSQTIALESQKIVYTGFIKYGYKWTFFCNTIVVGYLVSDNKYTVLYMDIDNNARLSKIIYYLIGIISNDFFCVLLTENKDTYNILFTNNFGNLIESKKCPIKPLLYSINNECLVISDGNYVYVLKFRGNEINNIKKSKNNNDKSNSSINNINLGKNIYINFKLDRKLMKEFIFFIDDDKYDINDNDYNYNNFIENTIYKKTNNPIIAIALSSNYLFISRGIGGVHQYDISSIKFEKKLKFSEKIKKLGISPFETYLWTIDQDDILRIHNIKEQNKEKENEFSKKEVWEIEWVNKREDFDENFEDSLSFVTVERNKLYFYSNLEHEGEPYLCTDYLAKYIDNEAIAVKLEDLINNKNNSNINPNNYIKKYENKILAEFNNLIETGKQLDEVYNFVKNNPNKKLWRKLSQKAMENLDFDTARKSMLQMNDFNGLEFINQIKNVKDPELQKAEIAQYNSNYEEASKMFEKNNRSDLNLAMLMKLGKWEQVSDLMSKDKDKDTNIKSKEAKEEQIKMAYNNYADELFEKKEFDKAEENYKKSGNIKGLTNCYFEKEEYDKAAKMLEVIPEEDEFLEEIGEKFLGLGMCQEAAMAFTKHGNIKRGIESYINCNKWEEAIDLSAKNDFLYMEQLVNKFSDQFRLSGKKLDLINLYKKANMSVEVYNNLCEIAQDMRRANVPPLIIKKIYVLAALELERYKKEINQQINEENLINEKIDNNNNIKKINYIDEAVHREIDKIANNPWRGAEAYHFYLLCQRQLHQKKYKESCKTALRLKFYKDILGTEIIYKLIAICSYLNKCYKFFADALIILSNDKSINKNSKLKFKNLSKNFFLKNKPENKNEKFYKCPNPNCDEAISEYDTYCNVCGFVLSGCVLSGKSILDNKYFKCKQCRNKTIKIEAKNNPFKHCPLCHLKLFSKRKEG